MSRRELQGFIAGDNQVLLIGENHSDDLAYSFLTMNLDLFSDAKNQAVAVVMEGISQDLDIESVLGDSKKIEKYENQLTLEKIVLCHSLTRKNIKIYGCESEASDPTIHTNPKTPEEKMKAYQVMQKFLQTKRTESGNVEFSSFISQLSKKYKKIIFIGGKAHLIDLYNNDELKIVGMKSRITAPTKILSISKTEDSKFSISNSVPYWHSTTRCSGVFDSDSKTSRPLILESTLAKLTPEEINQFFIDRINNLLDAFNLMPKSIKHSNTIYLQAKMQQEIKDFELYTKIDLSAFNAIFANYILKEKQGWFSNFFSKSVTINDLKKHILECIKTRKKLPVMTDSKPASPSRPAAGSLSLFVPEERMSASVSPPSSADLSSELSVDLLESCSESVEDDALRLK